MGWKLSLIFNFEESESRQGAWWPATHTVPRVVPEDRAKSTPEHHWCSPKTKEEKKRTLTFINHKGKCHTPSLTKSFLKIYSNLCLFLLHKLANATLVFKTHFPWTTPKLYLSSLSLSYFSIGVLLKKVFQITLNLFKFSF